MTLRFLGRYWPYLLALAAVLFALTQRDRANSAEDLAEARQEIIAERDSTIAGYQTTIRNQNEAITSLGERREEGRTIYLQDYARADERAQDHDNRAAELLSMQREFTEELAECRAAEALMKQEMSE